MPNTSITLLAAATASVMAEGLSGEELNKLAAFVTTVGDQLALISVCSGNTGAPVIDDTLVTN